MKPDLYNKKIRPVVQNPRLWQNTTTFQIPQDACKYTKQYFCELSWDSDILAWCLKTDKFSVSVPKVVYYIDKLNAEIFGSRCSKQTEDYSKMGKWHGADISHREIRSRGDTTIPKGNLNQGTKLERTITKFWSNGK